MAALTTDLRNLFENAIKQARIEAEKGAHQALDSLAVGLHEPFGSMSMEERKLRNRLRAHGRQLGDGRDPRRATQTTHRLMREVAYEQWHRMLFARFLAENELLIHPEHGVAVSLEECEDLARTTGQDPWALAASFAQAMLPQIFRADDPALLVPLPPETRVELQKLLASLPARIFTEDDALGWTYQFWQSAEKDAVNERAKSGEKITGETLPAVTQLFTEPYMVHFLLDNTIGAWHAEKVLTEALRSEATSEGDLQEAVKLQGSEGYEFEYLRFVREPIPEDDAGNGEGATGPWRAAAGTFAGWPRDARGLTVLDPCCGSGHFLVTAFRLLVALRMAEEGLSAADAARAVIRDNLFGLELDARCTQIAAFNLALAAWKVAGAHIELPSLRIACSGVGPQATKEEWLKLAEEAAAAGGVPGEKSLASSEDTLLSAGMKGGLEALYDLFQRAPDLGSLIDVRRGDGGSAQVDALKADFEDLAPLIDAILGREGASAEEVERAVAAKGMAEAARILAGPPYGYTLVITNVPYLGRGSHTDAFKAWADKYYREARNDLATIFLMRMLRWVGSGERAGTLASVTPQNWLFQSAYAQLRVDLLRRVSFGLLARLGYGAFSTTQWDFGTVLSLLHPATPGKDHVLLDLVLPLRSATETKPHLLRTDEPHRISQLAQSRNPDAVISHLTAEQSHRRIGEICGSAEGTKPGQTARVTAQFWEVTVGASGWELMSSSPSGSEPFSGNSRIIWNLESPKWGEVPEAGLGAKTGLDGPGVILRKIGDLPVALYMGNTFDNNCFAFVPVDPAHLPALYCFMRSEEFVDIARSLNQKNDISLGAVRATGFEIELWAERAERLFPNGLPEPYSDDPTQWLFHGHPARAESGTELHVALARLLGHRWPAESDPEMRLSDEARALIRRSAGLDALGHPDDDGIVCLSPVRGEGSAADRLRALVGAAHGDAWSTSRERELLAATASAGHGTGKVARNLNAWLRDSFFEEHCKLFQHRPFVWHIWDGQRGGFSALVNYHRLAGDDASGRKTLELLTYSYLGEWIDRQRKAQESGEEGADARLAAALRLQEELRGILEGEPPYDLFVRWKPLHEQPLGWDPDVNDGVRLNIRPFLLADDMGRKGAGILRWKPNVKWTKDRGKEPEDLRPREDFPWFWGCNPDTEAGHRVDFGAETADAAPAARVFDGARWNELHYTRAARAAARTRAKDGS
ncbi:MAG: DNA methyltransferase [Dehalococcoidia bacterium]